VKAFIASLSDSTAPPTASGSSDSASKFIRETRPTSTESLDLDKEAKRALDATNGYLENAKDGVEDQGGEEEDFETEDEILMRALEEAELEVDMDIKSGKKRSEHRVDKDGIANEDETEHDILARAKALAAASSAGPDTPRVTSSGPESPKLSFPSLPSHLPKEEEDTEDALDAEARARMEMLLGLSGPSTKPGAQLSCTFMVTITLVTYYTTKTYTQDSPIPLPSFEPGHVIRLREAYQSQHDTLEPHSNYHYLPTPRPAVYTSSQQPARNHSARICQLPIPRSCLFVPKPHKQIFLRHQIHIRRSHGCSR